MCPFSSPAAARSSRAAASASPACPRRTCGSPSRGPASSSRPGACTPPGTRPKAPAGGARRAKAQRLRDPPRRRLAHDGQRLGIFQTDRDATRSRASYHRARVLARSRPICHPNPNPTPNPTPPMIRKTAAVWAGKATRTVSRATRRGGGTTLPGDIARAIDPKILTRLTSDLTHGSVVITGTNGKTTTSRLITWLLEGVGHRVVSNRAGANLIFGVTAAALDRARADGRLRADWGVFEIDEASLPKAVREIQPKATLVLNLFRDQLDRYGELESIARKIDDALSGMPA